jgi:hypothetical protein
MIAFQSKLLRSLGSYYVGFKQSQAITILRECNAHLKSMEVLCKVLPSPLGKVRKRGKPRLVNVNGNYHILSHHNVIWKRNIARGVCSSGSPQRCSTLELAWTGQPGEFNN